MPPWFSTTASTKMTELAQSEHSETSLQCDLPEMFNVYALILGNGILVYVELKTTGLERSEPAGT